jgi:hypothetical protein
MASGGHGLPKVSLRFAMPYPETTLQPFEGWPAHRAGVRLLPFGHPTPYAYVFV